MNPNDTISSISTYTMLQSHNTSIAINNNSFSTTSATRAPATVRNTAKSSAQADFVDGQMDSVYIAGCTVCSAGLVANVMMLILVCASQRKRPWKKQTTLLLNICVCDLLICSAGLIYFALSLVDVDSWDVDMLEKLVHSVRMHCAKRAALRLWDIGGFANMFGLLLMSIDGFVVVKFSLKHHLILTPRVIKICLLFSWVIAMLLGLIDVYYVVGYQHPFIKPPFPFKTTEFCSREFYFYGMVNIWDLGQKKAKLVAHAVAVTVLGVAFITLFLVYTYIALIVIRVQRARRERKASQLNRPLPRGRHANENKGVITTIILLVSFLMLWLPIKIFYLRDMIGNKEETSGEGERFLMHILIVICSLTGIVDAAINSFRSRLLGFVSNACQRKLRLTLSHSRTPREESSSYLTTTSSTVRTNTMNMSLRMDNTERDESFDTNAE